MRYLLLLIFLAGFWCTSGQTTSNYFSKADAFLTTHVKNGRVAYKTLHDDPSELDALLQLAEMITVSLDEPKTYQAFWINSYNVLVIKGVVDNYPVNSPLEVAGFFDATKHKIGGENITLNDIENKLLRGNFPSEARFHFALVCAGLGCPPIIPKAYKPDSLGMQLESQTKNSLNDPNFIKMDGNHVKVSQIFEWYKEDFTTNGQKLVEFINRYRTEKLPKNSVISYYPYDWTLNELK